MHADIYCSFTTRWVPPLVFHHLIQTMVSTFWKLPPQFSPPPFLNLLFPPLPFHPWCLINLDSTVAIPPHRRKGALVCGFLDLTGHRPSDNFYYFQTFTRLLELSSKLVFTMWLFCFCYSFFFFKGMSNFAGNTW